MEILTTMIIANNKPVKVIGYTESTMTKEFVNEIAKSCLVDVIEPKKFLALSDKESYQYIISISVDLIERQEIIKLVDSFDLDLITVIHDTAILNPTCTINPGTFVFPFCNFAHGASVGKHCIISPYSLLGHYVVLNDNCILRPGVMITDRATIGNNCVINIRSTVTNKVTVTDNVQISGCSSVTKDLMLPGQYAGTPARRIKD